MYIIVYFPCVQFRFATCLDVIFMIVGTLAATVHGAALPLLMLFFGDLINNFVYEAISSNFQRNLSLTFNVSEASVDCSTVFPPFNTSINGLIELASPGARCILGDEFTSEINIIVFIFVGIAGAVWIAAYLQVGLLQASAERQVQRIRLSYYKAVLRQNIAWFDANPSGEVASRVSE